MLYNVITLNLTTSLVLTTFWEYIQEIQLCSPHRSSQGGVHRQIFSQVVTLGSVRYKGQCPNKPGVDQPKQEAVAMLSGYKILEKNLWSLHRPGPVHLPSVYLTLPDIFQASPLSIQKLGTKSWRWWRPGGKVRATLIFSHFQNEKQDIFLLWPLDLKWAPLGEWGLDCSEWGYFLALA